MVRQTSIETFRQIKAEGLLSERRLQAYEALFHNGPMTQGECWDLIARTTNPKMPRHSIAPRFAELLEQGVIQEVGKAPCRLSGRECIVWDVTSKLPVKPEKRESELVRLRRENKELRREIADLQERLDRLRFPDPTCQGEFLQKEFKL